MVALIADQEAPLANRAILEENGVMAEFATWRAFSNFEREVKRSRRYVRSASAEKFLETIRHSCRNRNMSIAKGKGFWRAQVGHDWRHVDEIDDEIPCAFSPKRMVPVKDRALEGRVNPRGIPVLYLSSERNAAMSEVRPWLGSLISLGHFEITRDLSVVECIRFHNGPRFFFQPPGIEERDKAVWVEIDRAFAQPATRSDDKDDYVATQILAELFRDEGFDGVAYKSAFGENAHNLALFDLGAARLTSCTLFEVKKANLTFEQADSTYWVREAKSQERQTKANTRRDGARKKSRISK